MSTFPNPYYEATAGAKPGPFSSLMGETRADVCVVGGGFTGLSAALDLARAGHDVVLLEANTIASGASGCNGGQLTPLETEGPGALEKALGVDMAREMWRLSTDALQRVKALIAEHSIDCDIRPGWMKAAVLTDQADRLRHEAFRFRRDYGEDAIEFVDRTDIATMLGTRAYEGGLYFKDAIRAHPLKLAYGLARAALAAGIRIHERSQVVGYSTDGRVRVSTRDGAVQARTLVLACTPGLHLFEKRIDKYIIEFQSHICVTAPLDIEVARSLNQDDIGVSDMFPAPNYYGLVEGNRLFFGNEGLLSETRPDRIKQILGENMARVFPQLRGVAIDYGWTGRGALTPNFMPHLGKLHDKVYFSQVPGIVWSLRAGSLIAEAIAGEARVFDQVAGLPHPAVPGTHGFRKFMGKVMKFKFQRATWKIVRAKALES